MKEAPDHFSYKTAEAAMGFTERTRAIARASAAGPPGEVRQRWNDGVQQLQASTPWLRGLNLQAVSAEGLRPPATFNDATPQYWNPATQQRMVEEPAVDAATQVRAPSLPIPAAQHRPCPCPCPCRCPARGAGSNAEVGR